MQKQKRCGIWPQPIINIDTLDTAITYGDSEGGLGKIGTKGFKLVAELPAVPHVSLPDLHCEEENLINPSRWLTL